jgi:dTDP-4-amino-4,6-dideoxygalactose transaminase
MTATKLPILDLGPQLEAIRTDIYAAIERVVESGAFIMGPDVAAFESEVGDHLGTPHAIGLNSGTDALFLALRALNIGPGDEVITTPFTFFATAEAISHVGATPVFVDVDEDFNISAGAIERAITEKTRAIIPVHLYGRPAKMNAIMSLAKAHNLKVVEDCAQSFGATYQNDDACPGCTSTCQLTGKNVQTGTIGDIGTFSFFPSKNLGAYGDGGLATTADDELAATMKMLRVHGAKKKYFNEVVGYNSRLDTLQAAILRVKLPYITKWNEGRRTAASSYGERLADVSSVIAPDVSAGHVFHQYTIRVTNGRRDALQKGLESDGISTMLYYPVAVHHLPLYRANAPVLPMAEQLSTEVLSLPIWPELEIDQIDRVVASIKSHIG